MGQEEDEARRFGPRHSHLGGSCFCGEKQQRLTMRRATFGLLRSYHTCILVRVLGCVVILVAVRRVEKFQQEITPLRRASVCRKRVLALGTDARLCRPSRLSCSRNQDPIRDGWLANHTMVCPGVAGVREPRPCICEPAARGCWRGMCHSACINASLFLHQQLPPDGR